MLQFTSCGHRAEMCPFRFHYSPSFSQQTCCSRRGPRSPAEAHSSAPATFPTVSLTSISPLSLTKLKHWPIVNDTWSLEARIYDFSKNLSESWDFVRAMSSNESDSNLELIFIENVSFPSSPNAMRQCHLVNKIPHKDDVSPASGILIHVCQVLLEMWKQWNEWMPNVDLHRLALVEGGSRR